MVIDVDLPHISVYGSKAISPIDAVNGYSGISHALFHSIRYIRYIFFILLSDFQPFPCRCRPRLRTSRKN